MGIENKEICIECGGICCKKSGCDYIPSDFNDLTTNGLYQILSKGNISITSFFKFKKLPNGKKYAETFLFLRARNKNRDIVDLLSFKTTCSQLTDKGCKYDLEHRPSGGANLVPMANHQCYPKDDHLELMKSWESYQKVLSKLVKRISGYSVEDKLKLDIEQLFENVLLKNFDGVSGLELKDVAGMLPILVEIYPEEYYKVKENTKNIKIKKNTKI